MAPALTGAAPLGIDRGAPSVDRGAMSDFLFELRERLPVSATAYPLPERAGLIIVDVVAGFCSVGAGPLAPVAPDAQIGGMVAAVAETARRFLDAGRPVFALLDTHEPGRPEPPYPPHCERGSGQERLVPELGFLESAPRATLLEKDVINGFVGAMAKDGSNALADWILANDLEAVVVVGICTDICNLDLVVTLLSARNHHHGDAPMLGALRDVVAYTPGSATYDLPAATAQALGLPPTATHPQAETQHIGLYVMQARGAIIADQLTYWPTAPSTT
ncbi:nicotinamidase-related amidase [Methylopila capsulata]|uniref:Nicotinamidase-related amidase n=1 Tax=Methylopila capsulata TaxID=61654 RepID=A0A9W6IS54_9HYPH|nr:isochorismatase family protein [Methylopila capsulata]MBM7850238.1 nicotinamidase-related amidase [Methylopila capsulata]GLK55531.1 hypothetical protein GCM10008170_15500 [Methylopila capsulata]